MACYELRWAKEFLFICFLSIDRPIDPERNFIRSFKSASAMLLVVLWSLFRNAFGNSSSRISSMSKWFLKLFDVSFSFTTFTFTKLQRRCLFTPQRDKKQANLNWPCSALPCLAVPYNDKIKRLKQNSNRESINNWRSGREKSRQRSQCAKWKLRDRKECEAQREKDRQGIQAQLKRQKQLNEL